MNDTKKVSIFLRNHKLAVIATHSDNTHTPESALIAYAEDEGFCLYFQTGKHTRKAKNLALNHNVSFVIGFDIAELATMQYEGIAEQLKDGQAMADCKRLFLEKGSPTTPEYLERPDAILFKVQPKWISLSDYSRSTHPTVIVLSDFKI